MTISLLEEKTALVMYLLVYSVSRTLGHLPEALGIRSVEPWTDGPSP